MKRFGNQPVPSARPMITAILILCLILSTSCQSSETSERLASSGETTIDVVSQATLGRYRTNEVRDYQGMRLDPAIGPRDNSIQGVQIVDMESYELRIDGLVKAPIEFTYDAVLAMTSDQRLITLYCVEGWEATVLWEGVRIKELIEKAGGASDSANTVIFHCVDGYTTSLSLHMIQNWDIILAYKSNGLPLPPEMGFPFIVVAERKYGYKWARWVNRIEVSDNDAYRGYWESRGWDNYASIYGS